MNDTEASGTFKIYSVVLSVGVACSLAIVSVYEVTLPIIERNQTAFRQQATFAVLQGAVESEAFQFDPTNRQFTPASTDSEAADTVYAGFDPDGELVGIAIAAQGMGYQDTIRVLYGYSPAAQAIVGIRVLESRETPGLGDRIESDPNFLANFERLDVSLDASGTRLENAIKFVKPGTKTESWQIDGITGATISSRATAEMLGESADHWIPRIRSGLSSFTPTVREEP